MNLIEHEMENIKIELNELNENLDYGIVIEKLNKMEKDFFDKSQNRYLMIF